MKSLPERNESVIQGSTLYLQDDIPEEDGHMSILGSVYRINLVCKRLLKCKL